MNICRYKLKTGYEILFGESLEIVLGDCRLNYAVTCLWMTQSSPSFRCRERTHFTLTSEKKIINSNTSLSIIVI